MTEGQPKNGRKTWTLIAVVVILALLLFTIIVFAIIAWQLRPVSTLPSEIVSSPAPQYLQYPSGSGNISRIFLVSATSTFGKYPFASAVSPAAGSTPVIKEGDTCLIINATIRNDYTLEDLPPNQMGTTYYANGTSVNTETAHAYVFLTAQIYDKQGTVINAVDVTPPYDSAGLSGAYVSLQSGENASLTMYFATSRQDISYFEVIVRYVGSFPPP